MNRSVFLCAAVALFGAACDETAPSQGPDVRSLADSWVAGFAAHDPLEARLWGAETDPEQLILPMTEAEMAHWRALNQALQTSLAALDPDRLAPAERSIYANVLNKVETELALTACHREFWPLNHVGGWHLNLPNSLGEAVLAAGGGLTAERLDLWATQLVSYMDAEEDMLEAGLAAGYSTPRNIAGQVAGQMDALASRDGELSAAAVGFDPVLAEHWQELMLETIGPRFAAHARNIRDDYMPGARTDRSIASLPEGDACYAASVFQHTGVRYTPETLLLLADTIVSQSETNLVSAGHDLWGLDDANAIRARFEALPDAELIGEEAVVSAVQSDANRLIAASAYLFPELPPQTVAVVIYPEDQRFGPAASYRPDFRQGYAGTYFVNPDSARMRAARSSEATTSHEVAPGHHMQAMIAYQAGSAGEDATHQILTIGINNSFVEGWARYAEFLATEEGLLNHPETRVGVWTDFGDVIPIAVRFNTGLASEAETARAALIRRGTPDAPLSDADNVLDWLAIMPGQILTYDIGADAIMTMRDRARAALGERFDYPTFHRLVLEEGSVPLWRVEEKVHAWIEQGG